MRRRSATSPSPPSAAASRPGPTAPRPPSSRRIRALEEWLGVVLFDRTALPVRLTAQGEQFLPVARDIVDRMAEARREFAAGNRSDGIVRLPSPSTCFRIFSSGCGRRAISSALWSIPFLKAWKSISAP